MFAKKVISLLLAFLALVFTYESNAFAQDSDASGGMPPAVSDMRPALKLVTKFAVPIAIVAVAAGVSVAGYCKYKNPAIKLNGEVTAKEIDDLFERISEMQLSNRNPTINFENAVIKTGAFHDRFFNHKVKFSGTCTIEKAACKNTVFNDDFEIAGIINDGSNLAGARFERSLIVNNVIPKNLFFGALARLNVENRYRLPEKFEITCDGSCRSKKEVKKYLEEIYFR